MFLNFLAVAKTNELIWIIFLFIAVLRKSSSICMCDLIDKHGDCLQAVWSATLWDNSKAQCFACAWFKQTLRVVLLCKKPQICRATVWWAEWVGYQEINAVSESVQQAELTSWLLWSTTHKHSCTTVTPHKLDSMDEWITQQPNRMPHRDIASRPSCLAKQCTQKTDFGPWFYFLFGCCNVCNSDRNTAIPIVVDRGVNAVECHRWLECTVIDHVAVWTVPFLEGILRFQKSHEMTERSLKWMILTYQFTFTWWCETSEDYWYSTVFCIVRTHSFFSFIQDCDNALSMMYCKDKE